MNKIDNEVEADLTSLIERTTEEFSLTLSSNPVEADVIGRVHEKITALHKAVIDRQAAAAQAEDGGSAENGPQADPNIHLKRLAV